MAVTTTKTNKPINPRGNDQSPKGYNRAALYSGKALDFDGTNDSVSITTSSFDLYAISFYFKGAIGTGTNGFVFHTGGATNDGVAIGHLTSTLTNETVTIGNAGNYTAINESYDDGIHFVVFSWDATNSKYKAYINAQEVDTFNNGSNAALLTGVTAPKLGYRPSFNDFYLDGGLSNVRAFSTALTAAQVADLYNNPEKIVPTGVEDTALKLWLPMMEGAGTTAINGAPDALGSEMIINGDFSDGSSNWNPNPRVTISGGKATYDDAGTGNFNQTISGGFDTSTDYILTFDISDASTYANLWIGNASGSDSYTNSGSYENYVNGHHAVFLKGSNIGASDVTLGFWISTGGSTFSIDNISLKEVANCGTISGATWTHGIGSPLAQTSVIDWNKWKLEGGSTTNEYLIPQGLTAGRDLLGNLFENVRKQGALNLDGNSWAEVHDNASLDFGTGSFTLEAWVRAKYVNTGSALNVVLNLGGNASNAGAVCMLVGSTNKVTAVYNNSYLDSNTILTEGEWYHLVVNFNGTHSQIYINGAFDKNIARTAADISNALVKEIGRDSTVARTYKDQIAQPRIYNRALTAEEIQRNFDAGKNTYTNS